MTNERYLVVSYLGVVAIVTLIAVGCFLALRRSFAQLTQLVSTTHWARILRASFPLGILLPVLGGLLSVQFVSCARTSYAGVVADRGYMMLKNQEQLLTALQYLLITLLVWTVIALSVLASGRRSRRNGPHQ